MWHRSRAWFRTFEMTAACLAFALLVGLIAIGSAGRYLGTPIIMSLELAQAAFVWLCMLAADLTLQENRHFSVDFLTRLLPDALQRALAVVTWLIVAALLVFLLWHGTDFTLITSDRPLPITGIPGAWVTSALPIGFVLMLITVFERIARILARQPLPDATPQDVG